MRRGQKSFMSARKSCDIPSLGAVPKIYYHPLSNSNPGGGHRK